MSLSRKDTAYLVLEDGLVFEGYYFGHKGLANGEVVFTTAMNGYVESLSDPSYKGQILAMTHPLIGNYGVPKIIREKGILKNFESGNIQASGLVLGEITDGHEWNSEKTLDEWLREERIPGIAGIDTRALTLHIREHGSMPGVITNNKDAKGFDDYEKINFMKSVSVKKPIFYDNEGPTLAVIDYGMKEGILDCLHSMGYSIARMPYDSSEKKVFSYDPVGIVLSNGPGNPLLLKKETETVSNLLEHGIPTLGICLGHQLIAMSQGMEIHKMRFGHRAINKGVIDLRNGRCMVTTHNHGYAVAGDIPKHVKISHISLDDKTIEGIRIDSLNAISVQFHPEARPGPNDGFRVFEEFDSMVKNSTRSRKAGKLTLHG